ncbi:MAG: exodeoxyribonuclease VII small subunit [Peptococcaceae bacterium]|nr:exodeoxyribonuclease VII small subunit [Peptococcaceae bacterium]
MTKKKVELSFEKGIERLEQIVSELDQNNLPLDEALARFQEGIELVRHCNRLLDLAEAKIKVLMEDSEESTKDGEEEVIPGNV